MGLGGDGPDWSGRGQRGWGGSGGRDRNGFKPQKVNMMEQCNPGLGVGGLGVMEGFFGVEILKQVAVNVGNKHAFSSYKGQMWVGWGGDVAGNNSVTAFG